MYFCNLIFITKLYLYIAFKRYLVFLNWKLLIITSFLSSSCFDSVFPDSSTIPVLVCFRWCRLYLRIFCGVEFFMLFSRDLLVIILVVFIWQINGPTQNLFNSIFRYTDSFFSFCLAIFFVPLSYGQNHNNRRHTIILKRFTFYAFYLENNISLGEYFQPNYIERETIFLRLTRNKR